MDLEFTQWIKRCHLIQRTGVLVGGLVGNLTINKRGKFRAFGELDWHSLISPNLIVRDTFQVGRWQNSGVGIKIFNEMVL